MPDILDSAAENGMSVYYAARIFPDNSSSLVILDKWGQVTANMDYDNVKDNVDEGIRNITIENLWVEPYGIKLAQVLEASKAFLSVKMNIGYCEIVKSLIAGYVAVLSNFVRNFGLR